LSPTIKSSASPVNKPANRPQPVFKSPAPNLRPQSTFSTPQDREASSSVPPLKSESPSMTPLPETDEIMSAIQNANANAGQSGNQAPQFDFPAALSNYQTAGGNVPLTPQQRNDVLSLMANNASAQNTNNALTNPHPPEVNRLLDDLNQYRETQQQLELLQKMSEQQNSRVQSLQERLQPLSPSGQIPGMNENSYFGNAALGDPGQYDLDLDSFVQDQDYFPNDTNLPASTGANDPNTVLPDFSYDLPDADGLVGEAFSRGGQGFDGAGIDPFNFNENDGTLHVNDNGERIESVSSNATSPAATVEEVEDETRRQRSPKRRRT
jgi:heat shock transcription factor